LFSSSLKSEASTVFRPHSSSSAITAATSQPDGLISTLET
jgi:hypothetical protein